MKVVLAEKSIGVSFVRVGNPSSGISPTIPQTSGISSSYSLPLTRKREWTRSTAPAPETTARASLSNPADRRDTREARKKRIAAPDSAVAPISISKSVRDRRLSFRD